MFYAEMKRGRKIIYARCYTESLMREWISDNEKFGYKLTVFEKI